MNYEQLKELVSKHCHLYYTVNRPEISDQEFDHLYDALELMEEKQGWAAYDSPTRRVGGAKGKIRHKYRLYSLKKVYNLEEVDNTFTVKTPKIDGANVTLIYTKNKLRLALTRGDGEFGEDVTALINTVDNIPTQIKSSYEELVINGECVTDNTVNNFRNYVSGALGLDSVDEFKTRNIKFIAHDWLGVNIDYTARMNILKTLGFDTVFNQELCDKYPKDGEVYRLDSYKDSVDLGWTSKYPRFATALKPRGVLTTTTELQNVIWVIGRTGSVNPVGQVMPVSLDGAVITRVTLHNIGIIEEHNLGLGDIIEIERAGGIIPKLVRVVEHAKTNNKVCARHAEEQLDIVTYRVGPKLFCNNAENYTGLKTLEHFIKVMDIKGLGPSSVKKMGLLHPLDLYKEQNWSALGVNGIKIKNQIEKSKTKPYYIVLTALGIPSVGEIVARAIVKKIPRFDRLRDVEHIKIENVGEKSIDNILSWLDVNEDWVNELPVNLSHDLSLEEITAPISKNKKVCITGKLDLTRQELSSLLIGYGYEVKNDITRDLYMLISGGDLTSKKCQKAIEYEIPIINFWEHKEKILTGQF